MSSMSKKTRRADRKQAFRGGTSSLGSVLVQGSQEFTVILPESADALDIRFPRTGRPRGRMQSFSEQKSTSQASIVMLCL